MTAMTLSRGQLQDLLNKFATENPKYREKLISDPKWVLEKQLNKSLGDVKVKSVVEDPNTIFVVVPHVAKEGELSDADLEKVAGGFLDFLNAECEVGGGVIASNVMISL
jgi:hypothetical protein